MVRCWPFEARERSQLMLFRLVTKFLCIPNKEYVEILAASRLLRSVILLIDRKGNAIEKNRIMPPNKM